MNLTRILRLNILSAICLCFAGTLSAGSAIDQKIDSITQLLNKYYYSQATLSHTLINELYDIAYTYPDKRPVEVIAIHKEAVVGNAQGKRDSSLTGRIDSLLLLYDEVHFPFENALLLYSLSLAYITQSDYAAAFQNAFSALEQFEALGNKPFIVKSLMSLGSICPYILNYNMAEAYFDRANEMLEPGQREYAQIRINKSRILSYRREVEKAIDSLLHFMPLFQACEDSSLLFVAYSNLGANYLELRRDETAALAYDYFTKASRMTENMDNGKLAMGICLNFGNYYHYMKQYKKALEAYEKAKIMAIENDHKEQLLTVLYCMAGVFEQMGKFDSAFYCQVESNRLNAELMNNPKAVEVYQSYLSMRMEVSENKLQLAEKDLLLKNKQVIMTTISFVAVFLVFALIFVIMLQNRRNIRQRALLKEAENKELSERLLQEQKIKGLQEEKLEAQMREVTSYSVLLSAKNNLLYQINELTEQLSATPEKLEDISGQIKDIVKTNSHTEEEWDNFVTHFNNVHPRFFDFLQTHYTDMTRYDLKLAAYIRIGMSTKQIAQLLNVAPDSIKMSRWRLRQKFGLKRSDNLDDFIQAM